MSVNLSSAYPLARKRRAVRVALMVLAQLVFAMGAVELLGQLWFGNPYYHWEQRRLFMSPDAVRNVGEFWTYEPHRDVREVAVYRDGLGRMAVEYDCHYRTDGMGLVGNDPGAGGEDGRRDFDLLVIGDSFTQGQGGCPWIGELRKQRPDMTIYNAGLQGTGPVSWARMTQYLMEHGFTFRAAVVLFISDDFKRNMSGWSERDLACLHDLAHCSGNFFYPLADGIDPVASARQRLGTPDLGERVREFVQDKLWVSHFLLTHLTQALWTAVPQEIVSPEAEKGLDWLSAHLKRVALVRIVQKDELALHSDNARTKAVKAYLRGRGLEWSECSPGDDGYLPRDGHPNALGYRRLASCVAGVAANLRDGTE